MEYHVEGAFISRVQSFGMRCAVDNRRRALDSRGQVRRVVRAGERLRCYSTMTDEQHQNSEESDNGTHCFERDWRDKHRLSGNTAIL